MIYKSPQRKLKIERQEPQ